MSLEDRKTTWYGEAHTISHLIFPASKRENATLFLDALAGIQKDLCQIDRNFWHDTIDSLMKLTQDDEKTPDFTFDKAAVCWFILYAVFRLMRDTPIMTRRLCEEIRNDIIITTCAILRMQKKVYPVSARGYADVITQVAVQAKSGDVFVTLFDKELLNALQKTHSATQIRLPKAETKMSL